MLNPYIYIIYVFVTCQLLTGPPPAHIYLLKFICVDRISYRRANIRVRDGAVRIQRSDLTECTGGRGSTGRTNSSFADE